MIHLHLWNYLHSRICITFSVLSDKFLPVFINASPTVTSIIPELPSSFAKLVLMLLLFQNKYSICYQNRWNLKIRPNFLLFLVLIALNFQSKVSRCQYLCYLQKPVLNIIPPLYPFESSILKSINLLIILSLLFSR